MHWHTVESSIENSGLAQASTRPCYTLRSAMSQGLVVRDGFRVMCLQGGPTSAFHLTLGHVRLKESDTLGERCESQSCP